MKIYVFFQIEDLSACCRIFPQSGLQWPEPSFYSCCIIQSTCQMFTYKILRKFSTISTFKPSLLVCYRRSISTQSSKAIIIILIYIIVTKKPKGNLNVNWIPSFPRPGDLPTAVKNKIKSSFQLHESYQRDWEMSRQSISASPDSDAEATCPTCWVVENAWMA